MIFRNITYKTGILIFTLLLIGGCSVWNNFTTYFNLYFNTAKLFDEAETEILNQKRDLFSTEPLNIPSNAKTQLVKVVEKASKILQFNANSSYVDDALMLLGKSFYYQSNFQKSRRKFEELLATNPDEKMFVEANLWIAKSEFELKENSSALKLINIVRAKAIEEGYSEIIKESYVEEIKYRIREKQYSKAISLANEFAEVYDKSSVRAQIYYELGNLYTLVEDNNNAISAYEKVFQYSPDFDLEISATIKYANSLRNAGQHQKALDVFEEIRKKDKFQNSFNEIDLEIGKTLKALDENERAYTQLKMVDSLYPNTAFASIANFELGELYRTKLLNYDSASVFFSKAATLNPPKDYQEKAKNSNLLFAKYGKLRKELDRTKQQLFYSENPDVFAADSAAYLEDSLKILNEYLAKKELENIWKTVDTTKNIKDSSIVKDSLFIADSLAKVDSLVKAGEMSTLDTVGLRARLVEYRNQLRIEENKNKKNLELLNLKNQGQIRLDTLNFKNNPPKKLVITVDSAKTLISKNNLELGNLFLAELNQPDSAYSLYSENIEKYQHTQYYPNTLYALGSYYLTINEKEKADSLFEIIYDQYKDKSIVNAAANKLNKPLIDLNYDPAKEVYASAETDMLDSNYTKSIKKLWSIYKDYPKSSYAPQALYATGWILENNLFLLDSAAVVYDTLIAKYPTTTYVKKISQKVSTYKQEKARIEKALQDSLLALKNHNLDTTKIARVEDDEELIKQLTNPEGDLPEEEKKVNIVQGDEVPIKKDQNNQTIKRRLEPLWDPRKHFN